MGGETSPYNYCFLFLNHCKMTELTRDHDYYVRLKGIDPTGEKAKAYKANFRSEEPVDTEPTDLLSVVTDEDITKANIKLLENTIIDKTTVKGETRSIKELKELLKNNGVKNYKFLSGEKVYSKIAEMKL